MCKNIQYLKRKGKYFRLNLKRQYGGILQGYRGLKKVRWKSKEFSSR